MAAMSTAVRILLVIVALMGIQFAARWAATSGVPTETRVPAGDLHSLPVEMGDWTGEDVPTDPRIFQATGALAVVDRQYTDATGHTVTAHVGLFTDLNARLAPPHQPEVCVEATGGRVLHSKDLHIETDGRPPLLARLLTTEGAGPPSYILYWYQTPAKTYTDHYGQREMLWSYRGRRFAPPAVKVMLQTSAPDSQQAQRDLTGLAGRIHAWVAAYLGPDSDQ